MQTLCCTDRSLRFFSSHSGVLLKCCYQAANELIRARGLLQSQVQDDFQQQSKHTMFRKEGHSMHNLSRLHRAIPFCGLKSACCPLKGGSRGQKAKSTQGDTSGISPRFLIFYSDYENEWMLSFTILQCY